MGGVDQEAVRGVVQKYIDGTYNGDARSLKECFHSRAVMNGYLGDQLLMGGPEPFFENIENNPSMAEGGAPYHADITSIEVVGNVAGVVVKETGFAGTMSFTNFFHLLKQGGEWKIVSKTFTTE